MTQQELDREVSNITGDDINEIRRHGFSLVDDNRPDDDPHFDWVDLNEYPPPRMVDWDQLQAERNVALFQQPAPF